MTGQWVGDKEYWESPKAVQDWKKYRSLCRYYERELKRIRGATAVSAPGLRGLAANALDRGKQPRYRVTSAKAPLRRET